MLHFSTGDWIAILVIAGNFFKWPLERFIGWLGNTAEKEHEEQEDFHELRKDLDVHKAEDELKIQYIKEKLDSIVRTMDNIQGQIQSLQNQMRFVASGSTQADRIIQLNSKGSKDD